MTIFKKNDGFINEIRCDESSYLIWKWHPTSSKPGSNNRENAIRWGSPLRVKDGEVAIFVYPQQDGKNMDYIEGPADEILTTSNLPVLTDIKGLAYGGGSPFQAEVYFINLARIIQTRFAVPFFDVYDSRYPEFGVPLAVRGTISFRISNYLDFIALHRLNTFDLNDFTNQIRDTVSRFVKNIIINYLSSNNLSLLQVESRINEINDLIESDIKEELEESYCVFVSSVDIGAIELDKSSDGYKQLMRITRDVIEATITAEKDAKVKDIADKQRINSEDYEEKLRIQRKEKEFSQTKQTPPPIPMVDYYVVINNKAAGPYDIKTLQQMALNNEFNGESLVWSAGMPQWVKAKEVEEVKSMLEALPPLPPI